MAEFMPDDYLPTPRHSSGGGYSGELPEARDLARTRPGYWVRVGKPRYLDKPPTAWVSEVNLGQKQCLKGVPGERWEGTYEKEGVDTIKLIRVIITPDVPPGFTPEMWATIPDAGKEAILAAQ
jgi:hypothetical protein